MTRRRRMVSAAVGLAVLVALVLLNALLFRTLFDSDYLRWFLATAP